MPKKCLGCVVFDGDGTLWFNSYKYNMPMLECAKIICLEFGAEAPYLLTLLNRYNEIDKDGVAKFGFGKERFPSSWVQTYREFCQRCGRTPDPKTERRLFKEASKFWQPPFPMKKNARKVLRQLKDKGFYLVLLTGGDPDVQQRKIETTRIKKYFNEIRIVGTNKSEDLKALAAVFGADHIWMVGDSKKSDMSAAIKAGVPSFYIPCENWSYENWDCDPETYHKFVTELADISEILPILLRHRR